MIDKKNWYMSKILLLLTGQEVTWLVDANLKMDKYQPRRPLRIVYH